MKCKEFFNNDGYYNIAVRPEAIFHTKLGRIRKKNDNRYEWFRWGENCWHSCWNNNIRNSQGVAMSRNDAIIKILEGWPEDIRKTSIFYKEQ